MEVQTISFKGANIELIKDDATLKRHAFIKVNGKNVLHLIENSNGCLNVFRDDMPQLSFGELVVSFEYLKAENITNFLRRKDLEL